MDILRWAEIFGIWYLHCCRRVRNSC